MILFELFYCFSTQMERIKLLLDVKRQIFPASFKKEHPTEVSYIYSEHLHIYLRGWMTFVVKHQTPYFQRGYRGHDRIVVELRMQSVPITSDVASLNLDQGKVYNIM